MARALLQIFRLKNEGKMEHITKPLKAIRAHCIQCVGTYAEVKECGGEKSCPLYAFRFGKNPFRTVRVMTDDQKKVMAERLQNARDKK